MSETYEPHLIDTVSKLLQPGDICIDAGAHTGEFTSVMAMMAGHVHAFEILPDNISALHNRFGINPLITINHTALSNQIGTLNLYQGKSSFEFNILGYDMRGNNNLPIIGSVQSTTIDDYMAGKTPRLDLVKMDVEGAENLVLEGMTNTLKTLRPIVIIEFHNDLGWAGRSYLQEANYKLWAIYHMNQVINNWVDYDHERIYHCMAIPEEKVILLESIYRDL